MANLNKKSILKKGLWILIVGMFMFFITRIDAGNFGPGTTFISINLSGNDNDNWVGNSQFTKNVRGYDNRSEKMYFGLQTTNKTLGWFDYKLNSTIHFNVTGSWLNNTAIEIIGYSYSTNETLFLTTDGYLGRFNPLLNNTIEIPYTLNLPNCGEVRGQVPTDIDFSINKTTRAERLYISSISTRLFYYDTQLNTTICIGHSNDPYNLTRKDAPAIAYDWVNNRTWYVGSPRVFAYFDEDRNITINMSDKIEGKIIEVIEDIVFDSKRNLIWGSYRKGNGNFQTLHDGLFYYNISLNGSIVDVSWNNPDQIINWTSINIGTLEFDDKNERLLISGDNGMYLYFDINANRTVNLNNTDTGNWVTPGTIRLSYDISRNNTYVLGGIGLIGVFGTDANLSTNQAPSIINNYTYPQLIPTLNSFFNITAEVNGTDLNDGIVYVNFSIIASNGSILLNNVNGTINNINGQIFNYSSGSFNADDGGIWRWNYTTKDNASSTEVFRSGQFTISDSTAPTLNITHLAHRLNPNNTNFSIDTTYRIQVNWTGTDNIRLNTMWYIFDHNTTNTTIPLFTNFTISIPYAGKHNITLFANDTTGNIGSTFINFSVRNDTQSPTVTITTPSDGGSATSQIITTTHSFSDDVEIYLARYSVYSGATNNIANTTIESPSSNTTLIYTTTLGCGSTSYTLYMWANDTSGNEQQTSSTYTCTTASPGGGSPGGGGGTTTLSALSIGQSCALNDQCSSSLCDLSIGSKFYGTCVNTLCGNGIKDEGESFFLCSKDFQFEGTGGTAGFVIKTIPYILGASFLALFLFTGRGNEKNNKIKQFWKKTKNWLRGLSKNE